MGERQHEFRCEGCGYGAVARIAPEFCPMCRGSVWMLATLPTRGTAVPARAPRRPAGFELTARPASAR
jgi:hypothetical protein